MLQDQSKASPILVIEGIDGSGKGTQSRYVCEALQNQGRNCELLSFPRYNETFFGQRIGDFLNGAFGTLEELNPFLVSLLYSGDRFESRDAILQAQSSADLLILDRYVPSNVAHQTAKVSGVQRQQLREWIEQIEFEIFAVPRPTQVVLLDTPVDISQNLIAKKEARSYTDQAADLQEANTPYLAKVRDVYLELAETSSNWTIIPVTNETGIRTIEDIGNDILAIAESLLA